MNMKPYKTLKIRNGIVCPYEHKSLIPSAFDCKFCEYYYRDGYVTNCFLYDLKAYLMYRVEVD